MMKYDNPLIYCDYSDPDVYRVGSDHIMTASSFCNVPGLPILKSRDLVHWKLVGYALKKLPDESYARPRHGCGVWAPAIRYNNGLWHICFPMPDEGIFMIRAKDPAGEWSEPVCLYRGAGFIDPCPFWDEDGKAYLVNGVAASRIGFKSRLYITPMAEDGLSLTGETRLVYDGTADGNITVEGPKLYKRNGYYYIFAPAGGVKCGWQVVLRSRYIYGPYESRIVMKQGSTGVNGPHQGAWVEEEDGSSWFIHFQDVFAAGRIVHLQPVVWKDGWPVIGEPVEGETWGEPVSGGELPWDSDEPAEPGGLSGDKDLPSLEWQWNAAPGDGWALPAKGCLRLSAQPFAELAVCDMPNLLLRKWEAPEFEKEFEADITGLPEGSICGMVSLGISYGGIILEKRKDGIMVRSLEGFMVFENEKSRACESRELLGSCGGSRVRIKMKVSNVNGVTAMSPKPEYGLGDEAVVLHPREKVRFSVYAGDGSMLGSYSYPAKAGRWVGVKYGFFCCGEAGELLVKEVKP